MKAQLTRKNTTYKLANLPELRSNSFRLKNGLVGYTGSLIKRKVKATLGIYTHTGFVYGFDHQGTLWIIENNIYGVECVTLQDFSLNSKVNIEPNTNQLLISGIMKRAHEKSKERYDARNNNCEHFTNYCLYGRSESIQSQNTEDVLNVLFSVAELYSANGLSFATVNNFTKIRKKIKLERPIEVEKQINQIQQKK